LTLKEKQEKFAFVEFEDIRDAENALDRYEFFLFAYYSNCLDLYLSIFAFFYILALIKLGIYLLLFSLSGKELYGKPLRIEYSHGGRKGKFHFD